MNMYRASELGTATTVNSVSCRMQSATSTLSVYDNYKVIIGHSALDATSANNFVSQQVVYDESLTVPAGLLQGDWITINLTTPFVYDGVSSLVVWMGNTSISAGAITHRCSISSNDAIRQLGQMGNAAPDAVAVTP